ncbi:MAG TPA: general stress protein [Mycobacteriales bacterium]|nr:general stress protein [Mycobacteriales bacterium]
MTRPFPLEYPQPLATYDTYEEAQRAVDYLSDQQFPVENLAIVGTDLRQFERVTGRLTYARAAGAGAVSGAWFGLLLGILLWLFATQDSRGSVLTLVGPIVLGALFGAAFGAAGYAATGGRRDFTSVSTILATRYEVMCEHRVAQQARDLLGRLTL